MRLFIQAVDDSNLDAAAELHAVSWQASHKEICSPAFVAAHTSERQREYLCQKLRSGSRVFLMTETAQIPVGLVAVTGNLIEDLYVHPAYQNRGCGTALLRRAIRECAGTPTLWILETNRGAARLYERMGFRPTGRLDRSHGPLAEIEYSLRETAAAAYAARSDFQENAT